MKKLLLILLLVTINVTAQNNPAKFRDGIKTPFIQYENLTTSEKLSIPQVKGTLVYDTDLNRLQIYNGNVWVNFFDNNTDDTDDITEGVLNKFLLQADREKLDNNLFEVVITPQDNPQVVFDNTPENSTIVFADGLHEWGINNNSRDKNAILYVDKPMNIKLSAGATLKLADNTIQLDTNPEITINQGGVKDLDDLSVGATSNYTGGVKRDYYVILDSEGAIDTFRWGYFGEDNSYTEKGNNVAITGNEQILDDGVKIKFDNVTGHNLGSWWFISYDGAEHYGIRIGEGFHENYIENVSIFGTGTIDLNIENNVQPSLLVADIPAGILVNGRVRNTSIKDVTVKNAHRTIMAYGENDGEFISGGGVIGGTSYDVDFLDILNTNSYNSVISGYGILLGHPSHRGWLRNVFCNYNYLEVGNTQIEPNFNLSQYEVIGNIIKANQGNLGIAAWRRSENGIIKNNVLIGDETANKIVVWVSAPGGWETAENVIIKENYNLTKQYAEVANLTANQPFSKTAGDITINNGISLNVGENASRLVYSSGSTATILDLFSSNSFRVRDAENGFNTIFDLNKINGILTINGGVATPQFIIQGGVYATDAEAGAAGVLSNRIYKAPNGELRYKL